MSSAHLRNRSRSPVTMYRESGTEYPAINVKYHRNYGPGAEAMAKKYQIAEKDAETILSRVYESAVHEFWRGMESVVSDRFGSHVKLMQAGRSGGWLLVDGLDDPATWTETMEAAWSDFENEVEADIDYRASDEYIFDMIEANEWQKEFQPFAVLSDHDKIVFLRNNLLCWAIGKEAFPLTTVQDNIVKLDQLLQQHNL